MFLIKILNRNMKKLQRQSYKLVGFSNRNDNRNRPTSTFNRDETNPLQEQQTLLHPSFSVIFLFSMDFSSFSVDFSSLADLYVSWFSWIFSVLVKARVFGW